MARLLLLTVVLIAYGSLYPWHFRMAPENPLVLLVQSWPQHVELQIVKDVAVNVLVYLPLGLFALMTLAGIWEINAAVIMTLLSGFLLSFSVEAGQSFIVGRVPSMLDIVSDTMGTAIGATAAMRWRRTLHKPFQRPDAELLLCCWVAYQCFPFLPHLTHVGRLVSSTPAATVLNLAQAAALVPAVNSIRGSNRWKRMILAGLLLLIPLKILIFTRTVGVGELATAALVFIVSTWATIGPEITAGLLAAALVLNGLVPFHFERSAHAFWWVPFQASFLSDWEFAVTVLLGKVFAYGALVWLLRECGVPLLAATSVVAAMLASIEIAQMRLAGRSSEITDPVLAALMGWVFWSLRPTVNAAESVPSKCSGP